MEESKEPTFKEDRINKIKNLYYSRKDIQKAIFDFSENREVVPRYFEGFGKRPDSLQYPGDIFEMVKRGATSFHCSEELWKDPLQLSTSLNEQQLNELRSGWDLLIDIDSKYIDYSKISAEVIIKMIEFHGVKNLGVKFSVSGDTPLLIKTHKEISLISIEEVINKLKKGERLEVLSLDKDRKLKFSKVYDFLEHNDIIYEIKHSQSTIPLKTTKHHSVFVWDKGDIIKKKVTELKKGDFLISFNTQDNLFENKNLKIINHFEFNKNQHSRTFFNKEIKITEELMRLIGYFLAEGHVTNIINQTGFSFNKNEVEYIQDVKNILTLITKRKVSIRHPNPNSTQVLIHSKEWATFFDNFCGKKKDKHVPSFVFQSPKKLFLELLKGYIRGDGYKIGEYGIVVKSVSKRLITEMVWLCKLNNISCNISYEQNKTHKLPQGNIFKGSLVYILRIPKSELQILEFNRKRNKFSPYAGDKIFPVDGLKEVYKQIKPKMFNSHKLEYVTLRKKRANINRIRKVLEWFDKFKEFNYNKSSEKIINNYKKLFSSDVSVVEISTITKKEDEIVYDVSVEETESFFGNYYPVLLHNSGSKGFHIIIPFKAFPKEVNNVPTKNLFPELARIIVNYINAKTKLKITEKINELRYNSSELFVSKYIKREGGASDLIKINSTRSKIIGKDVPQLQTMRDGMNSLKENKDSANKEVIPDLILVSPRHLFRMPYSLHEKTSMASVVIDKDKIADFQIIDADPLKAKVRNYIPEVREGEASELLMQALDWNKEKQDQGLANPINGNRIEFKPIKLDKLSDSSFPPCIQKILVGISDGKKRSLFVLINLFRSVGMEKEELEKRIYDWNKKNENPLKEGYIKTQISWSYRNKQIMPPNCKEYYQGLGVCIPDNLCNIIKNPVNYTIRKSLQMNKPDNDTSKTSKFKKKN